MPAEPHSEPPVASPSGSRRRYVVALLALLILGLGLTFRLTRPSAAPLIPLDAALETPGANPQASDLYAPPRLPATSAQASTPLPAVPPLTQSAAYPVSPAQEPPAALPAAPSGPQGATQVASAFTQAVAARPLSEEPPLPVGRRDSAAAPAPTSIGPGSLTSSWAGTTLVGGAPSSLVALGGLTQTSPIGLVSPIANQPSAPSTAVNVQAAPALDVPDRTGWPALLVLVGALLLSARRRLGRA